MESAPTTEAVLEGVYALYYNPNRDEKERASKWLEELQKSVYSWTIADELLQQKRDLHSCYFAAQTMRSKIQNSFHELPATAHESLRDSLISHITQITNETNPIIVTQLCLALSDLALLMSQWNNPILNLIDKFSSSANTIWPLILILTLIPEEINSRYLRLGANRREEIHKELEKNSRTVIEFLTACLTSNNNSVFMQINVIKCFTSWICIHAISLNDLGDNIIIGHSFNALNKNDIEPKLHDTATDCLCTLLQSFESSNNNNLLEMQIFSSVVALEDAYHMFVAHEDLDKAINYCRIFTVLGESYLDKILNYSEGATPHFAIKILDLVLDCVGHYDYEVAEITFNLWYRLSEDLYHKNNDMITLHFKPHIERLITALYRHSQMEPDHEGLIEEGDSFSDFRRKVSELIRDVVFIIGSSNCFKQMFYLSQEQVTWESVEAALFIMTNVGKNIIPDENEVVPKVVEAILNLPENTHLAVRYTSIILLGELSEWIESHPESLQAVLNFLLYALQQKHGLALAAATALQSICSACRNHMTCHINGLLQIAKSLDSFELTNDSAIGLLKGISIIVSRLPKDQVAHALHELCSYQLASLCHIIDTSEVKVEKGNRNDPSFWLDRLAALLRHTNPDCSLNEIHPCLSVVMEIWPVLSKIMDKYQLDLRIMERTCRCIRYSIRCVGTQASQLLDPLVKQMIQLYGLYQHSCFLYLGSILVDEFAKVDTCQQGLLDMLQAFIEPTFNILQVDNGLKNHPDTVDDFFRLCTRLIQRCSLKFLQSQIVTPIIQCALLACTLDHRDANVSVMKFFCSLLSYGRNDNPDIIKQHISIIVNANGEALIMNLLHASVFCLHSYMLADVADVIIELKAIDNIQLTNFLKTALDALPKKNSGGYVTATQQQLNDFHESIMRSETSKSVTHALKEFARLYR